MATELADTGAMRTSKHSNATFGTENSEEAGRERWPSRTAFYLAAIGSAVGFGNVWRFPALAKDYGGGAFFIPYLLALFLIGLPTLVLEISLGQVLQTGNVGVFGYIHKRFRGVGVASVCCAFMLVIYYSILLAWVARAFFESFGNDDPWARPGTTGEEANDYFSNKIIGLDTLEEDDGRPTRLIWRNAGYAALVWLTVWGTLAFGLIWTGRFAYFTMGLPIIILFVFFFRSIGLDGASDGIEEYIGKMDMSVLTEQPDVWSTAVSQIFFSLGVVMGVMPAYGSHCPRGEPAFWNSIIIGLSNSAFSFISGFAVFSAMGHLAHLEGIPVDEVSYAGFSLVFGTWPVVFGTFKGGEHWVRLLFFNLYLLGIDSAFSMLEAPLTVTMDAFHKAGYHPQKWMVSGVYCFVCFLLTLMYATDAGLNLLDAIDFYINFVFLLIGLLETFGAGWIYGIEEQIARIGAAPVFLFMFANFGSVTVASSLWFGVNDNSTAVLSGFVALITIYVGCTSMAVALLTGKAAESSWGEVLYDLFLKTVMDLRSELSQTVGFMPSMWAFMMRHFIPQVLLILFINLAQSDNSEGDSQFGHYGSYQTWPYQVLGMLCVAFAFSLFVMGAVFPSLFEAADLTVGMDDEDDAEPKKRFEEGMENEEPEVFA